MKEDRPAVEAQEFSKDPVHPVHPVPTGPELVPSRAITMARRGQNGRWLPGASANASGRPSIPEEVKKAARAYTPAALETLARVMEDPTAPHSAQVAAAIALLNRAWGTPAASIEAKVANVDLTELHLAALKAENELALWKGGRELTDERTER